MSRITRRYELSGAIAAISWVVLVFGYQVNWLAAAIIVIACASNAIYTETHSEKT